MVYNDFQRLFIIYYIIMDERILCKSKAMDTTMTESLYKSYEDELYRVLASLKNEEEFRAFFRDLCTNKEVEQMAQRLAAAEMLLEKKTYTQITGTTIISSATLSRVSRCIQYGSGGYNVVLRRYMEEKNSNE